VGMVAATPGSTPIVMGADAAMVAAASSNATASYATTGPGA
jgi:hypothetical protein